MWKSLRKKLEGMWGRKEPVRQKLRVLIGKARLVNLVIHQSISHGTYVILLTTTIG